MEEEKTGPSLGSRLLAILILAIGAWILLKVVIGHVAAVAWFFVVIVAIIAVVWAVRTLF